MKIALINENSQAAKNAQIYEVLNEEAQKAGHTVFNYGMYSAEDDVQLTYVKNGLLASILLTTKAVDFVVTGCGTGQGAMLACTHSLTYCVDTSQMLLMLTYLDK